MPRKKTTTSPQLLMRKGFLVPGEENKEDKSGWDETDEPSSSSSSDQSKCISLLLLKHDCARRGAEKLSTVSGQWREEQKANAYRMERQLKARWALDELISAQLSRFDAHYNHSMLPVRPRDVADILMPPWNPSSENAAVSWLGDWRPSSILSLIPILCSCSPSSPLLSLSLSLSTPSHRTLSEAIRRFRIQEAVLDEEMAEYQSTCIYYLPFGGTTTSTANNGSSLESASGVIGGEMRKMEGVVSRAQQLRYRALEVAVKKVLDRTQAAEFLVAFAGIQDLVHRQGTRWRARTGTVSITVHASEANH